MKPAGYQDTEATMTPIMLQASESLSHVEAPEVPAIADPTSGVGSSWAWLMALPLTPIRHPILVALARITFTKSLAHGAY